MIFFGEKDISPETQAGLEEARALWLQPEACAARLEALWAKTGSCAVGFARYKYYASQGWLDKAYVAAQQALASTQRQAGIEGPWQAQRQDGFPWEDPAHPAHFYLFTLKALAYLCVRSGQRQEACNLLQKLQELDPRDTVGHEVVRAILAGS